MDDPGGGVVVEMLMPPALAAPRVLFRALWGGSLADPPGAQRVPCEQGPGAACPPGLSPAVAPLARLLAVSHRTLRAEQRSSARPPCLHCVWAAKPPGKTGAALCQAASSQAGTGSRPGGLRYALAGYSKGERETKIRRKMAWEGQP